MHKKTRSILQELETIIPKKNKYLLIETRANHIIESAIHLLNQINENFGEAESDELTKRFFSSIKNKDSKRFERGIKKVKDRNND